MGKLAKIQRTMLENTVKQIRRVFNMAAISSVLTIAGAFFIHSNQDDGEFLDLHQKIPAMVDEISQKNPEANKVEIRKALYNRATETENMMVKSGMMFSGISLLSCGLFFNLKRKSEKALDALPPSP